MISDVLAAVKPPIEKADDAVEAPFPLLVGAAAGILQANGIVLHSRRKGQPDSYRLDLKVVARAFETAAQEFIEGDSRGSLNWSNSEEMGVWAVGFFLNKAQQNLAVALDKCVTIWLRASVHTDYKDEEVSEDVWADPFFRQALRVRLMLLRPWVPAGLEEPDGVRTGITALLRAIEKHPGPDATAAWLASESRRAKTRKRLDAEEIYSSYKFDPYHAIAIVLGRVAMIERLQGRPDRCGVQFPVEISLTAAALQDVSLFWRAMRAKVKPPR